MKESQVPIVKSSGDRVAFDESKLRTSLEFSGASKAVVGAVIKKIKSLIYPSITTEEIYELAYEMLMEHSSFYGGRYKIKKAIFELGPSGYPFEKYVKELFLKEGFSTQINQHLQGKCIRHEVDIKATKKNHLYLVECKYHSDRSRVCNVKTPLYFQSRFLDITAGISIEEDAEYSNVEGWMVTNTRFTKDAIAYARCSNLKLLSWNYPLNRSLKMLVEEHRLYPITTLSSLTQHEKKQLLEFGLVLCSQLQKELGILEKIGVSKARIEEVVQECHFVCYLSKNGKR